MPWFQSGRWFMDLRLPLIFYPGHRNPQHKAHPQASRADEHHNQAPSRSNSRADSSHKIYGRMRIDWGRSHRWRHCAGAGRRQAEDSRRRWNSSDKSPARPSIIPPDATMKTCRDLLQSAPTLFSPRMLCGGASTGRRRPQSHPVMATRCARDGYESQSSLGWERWLERQRQPRYKYPESGRIEAANNHAGFRARWGVRAGKTSWCFRAHQAVNECASRAVPIPRRPRVR
jgi:hypothetical protein